MLAVPTHLRLARFCGDRQAYFVGVVIHMRSGGSESQRHPFAEVLHLATVGEANRCQTPLLGARTPFDLLLEDPALTLDDRRLDFPHGNPARRANGQTKLVDLKPDRASPHPLQPILDDLLRDRHAALARPAKLAGYRT